jgi:hypothetical protein
MTTTPGAPKPQVVTWLGVRPIVAILIVLQLATPAVLLVARHIDPSLGQLPFGWQMHTTCWGSDNPRCD